MAKLSIHQEIRLGKILRRAASAWMERIGEIFAWIVPKYLREKTVEVDVEDNGDDLTIRPALEDGQVAVQRFAYAGLKASQISEHLAAIKSSTRADRLALVLRLPSSAILRKRFTLPNAAEINIVEATKYQIDLITPFRTDDVHFDVMPADLPNAPNTGVLLELIVVLKNSLEQRLVKLQQYVGQIDRVSHIGEQHTGRPVNLIRSHRRLEYARGKAMTCILAGLITISLIWGAVAPLIFQSERAANLASEITRARSVAKPLLAERQIVEKRIAREHAVLELDRHRADPLSILAELTKTLPDDTWLVRFSLRSGVLQITGMTPSTSKIMDLLAASSMFDAPSYVSPVVKDPQSGLERFVLNIRLRRSA